jgi:hypothetical protein
LGARQAEGIHEPLPGRWNAAVPFRDISRYAIAMKLCLLHLPVPTLASRGMRVGEM